MNYDEAKMRAYQLAGQELREIMSPASMPIGILLIAEAKKACQVGLAKETENGIYEYIQQRSAFYETRNVFPTSRDAIKVYTLLRDIDEFDWEDILASLDYRTRGLTRIPNALISLLRKHFNGDEQSVLICEGEKFCPYLHTIIDEHPECLFTITTMHEAYKTILEYAFGANENVSVVLTSIYEYDFLSDRFDMILAVPNFGNRMLVDMGQHFMCRELEMVAVENLLLHLNRKGQLLITLPARATYAAGNVKQLRDFIQEMYKLEEIDELPEGIFDGTAIKTYLFTITTGSTDDISIRKYGVAETLVGTGGRIPARLEMIDETFVMGSELVEQGDWNVDKIFAAQDADWQRFMDVKKIALNEVAQVFRGKNIPQKDETGNIGVVNISNLREYAVDYETLDHIYGEERRLVSYILQDGDVLLPARGTATRVAVFREQNYPCIASSNVIVIRPRKDLLNSTYLKMFLDSPLGLKILSSMQQGAAILNISYKDLQYAEIPLPDIDRQCELAGEYERELQIYMDGIKTAEERWNSVISRLQNEL